MTLYSYLNDFNWPIRWEEGLASNEKLILRKGTTFSTIIEVPNNTYNSLITSARCQVRDSSMNLIGEATINIINSANKQFISATIDESETLLWSLDNKKKKLLLYDFEFSLENGDIVGTYPPSKVWLVDSVTKRI